MTNETQLQPLPPNFIVPTGAGVKLNILKLKPADDSIQIRILPMWMPICGNDFGLFWRTHYGYYGVNPKDPNQKAFRSFSCIQERKGKEIIVACAECDYIARKKNEATLLKAQLDSESNPERKEKLQVEYTKLLGWIAAHNNDGKKRIPVLDRKGNPGIFLAPYNVTEQIKTEIERLSKARFPIQAAGRKGVWFEVTRTGKASNTSDKVTVCTIQRDDGASVPDFHIVSDEQLENAMKVIPDFRKMKEQNLLSAAQIQQLVDLDIAGGGSADREKVEAVFKASKQTPSSPAAVAIPTSTPVAPQTQPAETTKDPFEDIF
jgi:hypothetical protein